MPCADLVFGDVPDQIGGDAFRVGLKLVNELRIPEVVKVSGPESRRRDFLVVAATVIVVRAVQWLMNVADEVEEAVQLAMAAPRPDITSLETDVYVRY